MSDPADTIAEYLTLEEKWSSLPESERYGSPLHQQLLEMRPLYEAAKRARRLEEEKVRLLKMREERIARREETTEIPWLPPRHWISDGSYAHLSPGAQRLLCPLYALLRPTRAWTKVTLQTLVGLTGMTERVVGRGVRELWRQGWIDAAYVRTGKGSSLAYHFRHPPSGRRRKKTKPMKPPILRSDGRGWDLWKQARKAEWRGRRPPRPRGEAGGGEGLASEEVPDPLPVDEGSGEAPGLQDAVNGAE